jgi:hypothetical protein
VKDSELQLHMIRYVGISGHIRVPINRGVFRILNVIRRKYNNIIHNIIHSRDGHSMGRSVV